MQFSPLAQYVCSRCGSLLKESGALIDTSTVQEECPVCGSFLADTLQKKPRLQTRQTIPKLQTAYDLARLRLDIPSIDSKLQLTATGSVCICGYAAIKVLTRLYIRAIMPRKYGGLDSPHVIVVDAGNKSDFYQTVNFARQYGLDIKDALDRIIVSRTFTINQLKSIICNELSDVLAAFKACIVVIPGLLDLFDDPNIKEKEAKRMIATILQSTTNLSRDVLVATTLSKSIYSEYAMQSFQKRIILKEPIHQRVNVELYDGMSTQAVVAERELSIVPRT